MSDVHWIPIGAWIAAVVIALVVLGFCAYEIAWKSRRLRADLGRLMALRSTMVDLQHSIAGVQARVAAATAELR